MTFRVLEPMLVRYAGTQTLRATQTKPQCIRQVDQFRRLVLISRPRFIGLMAKTAFG